MKELQGKYIKGLLTIEEMKTFLSYNEKNNDAPFRMERIKKLISMICEREKEELATKELKQKQLNSAIEYKNLVDEWEKSGAYFESYKILTKWYYKGICFFKWFSGVDSIEHLKNAQKADIELKKIIKKAGI